MTTLRTLITIGMLCSPPSGVALAQVALAQAALAQADRTGTGGGPLSTEKAPSTTAVGQTKPPSRDASPASVKPVEQRTPSQAADDAISNSICIGCGAEIGTTGALSRKAPSGSEPRESDAQLNELRDAPKPKPQSELDTLALASAHREQARSMEEKTSGLWQSWLVSVCTGCGDRRPARALAREDWPDRNGPATTGSIGHKPPPREARSAETRAVGPHHRGNLEADLSPENVDSIRRTPRP